MIFKDSDFNLHVSIPGIGTVIWNLKKIDKINIKQYPWIRDYLTEAKNLIERKLK